MGRAPKFADEQTDLKINLLRWQMVPDEPVFVPNEEHHEQVVHRQCKEPDAVGESVAVQLIGDEQRKRYQRCGVGPQLLAK